MKYVSITFDDGREDNLSVAFPIMEQYHMKGTVYVTTGFSDGTWTGCSTLESPRRALSPDEIRLLADNGWEIGLHGDKHTTERTDFSNAYKKMNCWINHGEPGRYGYSVPNSNAQDDEIEVIRNQRNRVKYIRKGRRKNNSSFVRKALYVLSYYGGFQWAYNLYNRDNVFLKSDQDNIMYSVVVKSKDRPETIIRFLDRMPDRTGLALMLHSVLPSGEAKMNHSQWIWTEEKLNSLCRQLAERRNQVQVITAEALNERIKQI